MAKDVIAELLPVKRMMEDQIVALEARGYRADVSMFGIDTMAGQRGLRLNAARPSATHSLSIDIDVDALHLVKVLVDNALHEDVADTLFPKPKDLIERMRTIIAWFVDTHVAR